jgi:hypothetical protein
MAAPSLEPYIPLRSGFAAMIAFATSVALSGSPPRQV